jgi:hypothetical protein
LKTSNHINVLNSRGAFLLLFFLGATSWSTVSAQKNAPVPRGSLFWLQDGSFFKGQLVDDEETAPWKVRIITGDTLNITAEWVDKMLLPSEVNLYRNSSYHIRNGYVGLFSWGFSNAHTNLDLGVAKRFKDKIELGVGLGYHYNTFTVNTGSTFIAANINSIPLFVHGRYYLNQDKNRFYAKGRIGIANNLNTWEIQSIRPGFMGDLGIGLEFATKTSGKYFLELTQYTSKSRGVGRNWNWNPNGNGNGDFTDFAFNAWHHRIVLTVGANFGK